MKPNFTLCLFICAFLAFAKANAQKTDFPPATAADQVVGALAKKEAMKSSSIVKNIPFKNIGPSIMSGRVVDLAVNPKNPVEFYVAYSTAGVWYTQNNGTSFTPLMDNAPTQNVGDIDVHWDSGTIYVGTGENNSSRSSYAGIGILKSTDHGETWQNMGLPDSHHIGRIIVNPDNVDEVVVGAVGHLYSPNEERGVYRSIDGGKTWQKTLFIDEETGIIDLVASPDDFNTMFAASWQKDRKAWNFIGNGEGSAIYKSTDAGKTWKKTSTKDSGFPTGDGVGRIGIAAFDSNTIYAIHDSQFHRKEEKKEEENQDMLTKDDLRKMKSKQFLALDDKKVEAYLRQNGFQSKYKAENVKQMVKDEEITPLDLVKYLEDANSVMFDTPVIGAEVYRSDDGGMTWKKMNEDYIDGLFYSYGYYFAQIAVDPSDKDKIYTGGVPLIRSDDAGKTWKLISGDNMHSDHHAIWVDPNMPGHLINGNDGGINISYDDGETWIKNNTPSVGQFYYITVDNEKPYNVYGGLQDNGVWKGAHNASQNTSWHSEGQYPWKEIMGGDGMQVQVDSRNSDIVYAGSQFGSYSRINLRTGDRKYIQPKHELGESPYRFNWQTPILLSPHNQDILYFGGNKLHRSFNQGDDWETISGDLTAGGKKGNVAYGTLATISESPFQFGLIYTGSDDGMIHVTKDGGVNWEMISQTLPKDMWVSRVVASEHKKNRVYATLNGYRWDNYTPYVYRSEDMGKTWENISSNLPLSPVNVIVEDNKNPEILYVGTDDGLYVTLDMGGTWAAFDGGLPPVAVHDAVIQKEENDLLVGTHGRSIYSADLEAIHAFAKAKQDELQLFEPEDVRFSPRWGSSWGTWYDAFTPETTISFYSPQQGEAQITITGEDGKSLKQWAVKADKGFNLAAYDLTMTETKEAKKADDGNYYLPVGEYKVKISMGAKTAETQLKVTEARGWGRMPIPSSVEID
ncbi:MAG: glycosyl hydrolase [Cytophagaceae bacterium]|nr:glycosyl hydrolase [Cytophagaceae bacterium]|tara:strand:- start:7840 stop:10731 length:2892 start_codon:yes stop_codon:yes gene_type:complete